MAEDKKEEIKIIEINEEYMKDRLYVFRGRKVMLDTDLAEIYGYETKNFKKQVKNNIAKFEGDDFMFELNDEEVEELSRCKNFTLKASRGSNIKYKPYVFTEQGVYMLMTVLRGELAIQQSRALVKTFKRMKDYILENRDLTGQRELLQLSMETANNRIEIHQPDIPTVGNIETLKSAAIIRSGNLQIDLDNSASEELLARIVRFLNAQ